MIPFKLIPFDPHQAPELSLTGTVERQANKIAIAYELQGDLSQIETDPPHNWPTRQHNLWDTTCLELFFAPVEASSYWEVNLSPAGDWNVYRFEDYRDGMAEEAEIQGLRSREQREMGWLQVAFDLDISNLVPLNVALDVGVTCVLERRDRTLSYWAIKHPGTAADFHDRAGFTLRL